MPDLWKSAHPFSLFKLSWRFSNVNLPFYPFVNRGDDLGIDYPVAGLNWVWYPEVLAAHETIPNFWNWVYLHEAWEFVPETDNKPFAWLADLYEERLAMKKAGNGGAFPLKYGYTGTWGKLMQKLGYDPEEGRLPTYYNSCYAGYLTSGTRAKVWRAMMQEPKLILCIDTDGVKSLVPLKIPISEKLGEWSMTELTGITLVQSGVYWTHEKSTDKEGNLIPCVDDDGKPDPCWLHGEFCAQGGHTKGFDPTEVRESDVLEAWQQGRHELKVPARRFVGLASSVSPVKKDGTLIWDDEKIEQRWDAWGKWNTEPRTLKLSARGSKRVEKRVDGEGYPIWGKKNPSTTLIDTYARSNPLLKPVEDYAGVFPYPDEVLSRKHNVPWDDNPEGKASIPEEAQLEYEVGLEVDAEFTEALE